MGRASAGTKARQCAAALPAGAADQTTQRHVVRQPIARPSGLTSHGGRLALAAGCVALQVVASSGTAWAASPPRSDHSTATNSFMVAGASTAPTTDATQTTMPLPAPPPSAPLDTCAKGTWMPQVLGAPSAFLLDDGVYLWYDPDGGWALRVTHARPRERAVFSGSLYSATGQFTDVTTLGGGGNDIVYEAPNKHRIYFRFVNFSMLDGLNFGTECARGFSIGIHIGHHLVPRSAIHLGSAAVSPPSDPFRVDHQSGPGPAGLGRKGHARLPWRATS